MSKYTKGNAIHWLAAEAVAGPSQDRPQTQNRSYVAQGSPSMRAQILKTTDVEHQYS